MTTSDGVAVIEDWRCVSRRLGEDERAGMELTADTGARAAIGETEVAVAESRP